MRPRHALVPVLALPLAAMALLAAGCGSASPSRGVADVGSSGAATTQSGSAGGPSSASSGSSSGGGGGPGFAMKVADGARFAACMRSHGVPRFPDPSAQGAISIGPGAGINPDSPKFKAAQKACEKLLPNGGQPTPQEQAKLQAQALAFSACMRKHGIPNFPDPQFSGGHVQISIKGGPGSGLDPKSPKFQAAQKACQGNLPGARTGGVSAGR